MTRRILQSLLVLAVVLALNFLLFRIMPGDPVASIVDPRFPRRRRPRFARSTDWTAR